MVQSLLRAALNCTWGTGYGVGGERDPAPDVPQDMRLSGVN